MTNNKEKMLHMVLDNKSLQELYDYDLSDYEDLETAKYSENVVVSTVAKIISDLEGRTDESSQKKVYMTIFNYISNNYLL